MNFVEMGFCKCENNVNPSTRHICLYMFAHLGERSILARVWLFALEFQNFPWSIPTLFWWWVWLQRLFPWSSGKFEDVSGVTDCNWNFAGFKQERHENEYSKRFWSLMYHASYYRHSIDVLNALGLYNYSRTKNHFPGLLPLPFPLIGAVVPIVFNNLQDVLKSLLILSRIQEVRS